MHASSQTCALFLPSGSAIVGQQWSGTVSWVLRDQLGVHHPLSPVIKGGPEPIENEFNEILNSKREDRVSKPFFEMVKTPAHFVFRSCLASAISVRPRGTCKGPAEVPQDSRVFRMRLLSFPTSDGLDTWLIPSGTKQSTQNHESTMV